MEIADRFGWNLRHQRVRAEMTQEEVAELAGMHRTEVSLLETGGRKPRMETLLKLAAVLDTSLELLVEGIRWEPGIADPGHFRISDPRDR